jgi:signal transduction histidine kinase
MVSLAFFAIAAAWQPASAKRPESHPLEVTRLRVSWLPYVGLGANVAILLYVERHGGTTLVVAFAATAALVGLVSMRQMVVQSELLVAQRSLRDSQADRAVLLDRTIALGEEERARLAGELHDGPVQRLAALGYLLERSARLTARGDSAGLGLLSEALGELNTEVNGLRRLMAQLRPPVLDESGLENALRDHMTAMFMSTGVTAELIGDLGDERLAPEIETVMYRVAVEALLNVAQHASATNVRVQLERFEHSVIMSIADDGVGFSHDQARSRLRDGHFGLVGMRERIELGGGSWHLKSSPGEGTRITASLLDRGAPAESLSEIDAKTPVLA